MLINTETIIDFWEIRGAPEWPECNVCALGPPRAADRKCGEPRATAAGCITCIMGTGAPYNVCADILSVKLGQETFFTCPRPLLY